jgi:choline monooxygenase
MDQLTAVGELVAAARRPFDHAVAMPPSVYKSEAFLDRELETVFRKEWICVGRSGALKQPGDYLTYEVAGQPLIVLRGEDGGL